MDTNKILNECLPTLKRYSLPIVVGGLGLMCLGYGLIVSFGKSSDSHPVFSEASNQSAPSSKEQVVQKSVKTIFVDIEGAIVKPGVYQVQEGSRMQDALIAAGGLSDKADREVIAHSLNLAAPVADGAKIYIPYQGEQVIIGGGQAVAGARNHIVDINHATADELNALPGIGEVTSQKIISGRPYQNTQELVQKRVVGQKVFQQIKDSITAQ